MDLIFWLRYRWLRLFYRFKATPSDDGAGFDWSIWPTPKYRFNRHALLGTGATLKACVRNAWINRKDRS
jgi:hypothetical protein